MGTCTRLDFLGLEKNPETYGDRPIWTFMIFLIKSQLWGPDGHLHAPRFFGTGKKSRPHRGQANLNFHDFFDQKPIMGNRWAPARASIFRVWTKIPTPTGTDQFKIVFFGSQITNYGDQTSTCIIHWFFAGSRRNQEIRPPKNPTPLGTGQFQNTL